MKLDKSKKCVNLSDNSTTSTVIKFFNKNKDKNEKQILIEPIESSLEFSDCSPVCSSKRNIDIKDNSLCNILSKEQLPLKKDSENMPTFQETAKFCNNDSMTNDLRKSESRI